MVGVQVRDDPLNTAANTKQFARNVVERPVEVRELLVVEITQTRKQDLIAQFAESVVRHVRASCGTDQIKDMRGNISARDTGAECDVASLIPSSPRPRRHPPETWAVFNKPMAYRRECRRVYGRICGIIKECPTVSFKFTAMVDTADKLGVLKSEYERMCTEIRSVEANNEKAVAFGLSIITAAFAVGAAQHVFEIFFIIPIAITGVFFYAVLMYTFVFSMGGYKAFLEDRLNELMGSQFLLWERLVHVRQRDNMIRPALVSIYLLIAGVLTYVSVVGIMTKYGFLAGMIELLLVLLLLMLLLFALMRMEAMYQRIYSAANELYRSGSA